MQKHHNTMMLVLVVLVVLVAVVVMVVRVGTAIEMKKPEIIFSGQSKCFQIGRLKVCLNLSNQMRHENNRIRIPHR
jgi:hypothetical protein